MLKLPETSKSGKMLPLIGLKGQGEEKQAGESWS